MNDSPPSSRPAPSASPAQGISRSANLCLWALSLGLLLLPLTAFKPGLPATFKADEPAYFLAALSLVEDFDLRADRRDRDRIFQNFPYRQADNVIISSGDGWRTLYFGKPYLYSLCAAPFVALWGVEGMVMFNMLMLVGMIWMAALWLRRFNPGWLADLYAAAFFLLGIPYTYVYWLHPEVFNMFSGAACLFLGLRMWVDAEGVPKLADRWAMPLSAACLAAGVYNKPMLAALGIPVCLHLLSKRQWKSFGVWLTAATVSILAYAGGSWLLTGHATAYLVDLRAGYPVFNPDDTMVDPVPLPDPVAESAANGGVMEKEEKKAAGWWWILQKPHVKGFELAEDIPLFFVGRHTGLLVYQPMIAAALLLFLLYGARRAQGWWILGSALLVGLFFIVTIPFNWHGGGGFVGNRYFVMATPAFVFLVTRIRAALLVPFFAAAGLLVGPLVLAPYGLPVPRPTLQSHARNPPFEAFPLELGLGKIPGYHGMIQQDLWMWGRQDHLRVTKQELLIVSAADEVQIWLQTLAPIDRLELELAGPLENNRAVLTLGGQRRETLFGHEPTRLVFEPQGPDLIRRDRRPSAYFEMMDIWNYRLTVHIERGELTAWHNDPGPRFFIGGSIRLTDVELGKFPEPAETPSTNVESAGRSEAGSQPRRAESQAVAE